MSQYDIQLMVQVAKMYYMEGMTQQVIAKQLGISRSAISMVLTRAREHGIVEINIKDPKDNVTHLADEFISKFNLKDCWVMPTSIDSPKLITRIVASMGADLTENVLTNDSTIGIAWGSTCYEVMNLFTKKSKLNNINVVPLIGGTARVTSEYQLNEMVRIFAEKLHGTPTFIHAPAIAETTNDKSLYMQSVSMQSIIEKWNNLDAAIVSAGAPPEFYFSNVIFDPETHLIEFENDRNKAVTDICARRINIYGEFLQNDYNSRVMGVTETDLRRIEKVICIASGKHKILSIIGTLRTRAVDYFVTDEKTAEYVLDILNK